MSKRLNAMKVNSYKKKRHVSSYPSKICYIQHVGRIGEEEMMTEAKTILRIAKLLGV